MHRIPEAFGFAHKGDGIDSVDFRCRRTKLHQYAQFVKFEHVLVVSVEYVSHHLADGRLGTQPIRNVTQRSEDGIDLDAETFLEAFLAAILEKVL